MDIGKLHEQVQTAKTLQDEAQKQAASYHRDLLEIKQRIMDQTQKFDRGRSNSAAKKRQKKKGQ